MGTDISYRLEQKTQHGWEKISATLPSLEGQDYLLFQVLAGVRRLSTPVFVSIAPPRGFPDDLSPEVREKADEILELWEDGELWGPFSWFTVQELINFPWHETKRHFRALVNRRQFELWQQRGRPDEFIVLEESPIIPPLMCADLAASTRTVITNDEMERRLFVEAEERASEMDIEFTEVHFDVSYADLFEPFVKDIEGLLVYGHPSQLRLVFWFGS